MGFRIGLLLGVSKALRRVTVSLVILRPLQDWNARMLPDALSIISCAYLVGAPP